MSRTISKSRRTAAIVAVLLLSNLASIIATDWSGVRSVDIAKLFAAGMLAGVLIMQLVRIGSSQAAGS